MSAIIRSHDDVFLRRRAGFDVADWKTLNLPPMGNLCGLKRGGREREREDVSVEGLPEL